MIKIATATFDELDKACKGLGLAFKKTKKGHIWKGISSMNGNYIIISIHDKAKGRNMATGTFNAEMKKLGFKNINEFRDFLKQL